MREHTVLVVDCQTCPVRGLRCDDCVVTALSGTPVTQRSGGDLPLDHAERRAVGVFVAAGLVDPGHAATLRARPEPVTRARSAG